MLDVNGLLAVGAAFFVVTASPGPATLALASTSLSAGRKAGLRFGIGLAFGLAFWGLIAATGLGAILQASGQALTLLKIAGGAYLLWLAYGAARSAAKPADAVDQLATGRHSFKAGLMLNLLNPQAVFAWMATLALGLGHDSGGLQVFVATSLCMLLGAIIYALYALMLSTGGAMGIYGRLRRWIEGAVAGLFALASLALIRSAFVRH